ncbi:MAG: NFACT RNA binding domain-containing protein, partial [Candidatus Zixiibacteriota bacterium]
ASDRLSPLLSDTGSLEPLQRTLIETGNLSITTFIEKQVAGFNRTMAREAIARADESRGHSANADMSPMNSLTGQIARMAEQFLASSAAYLYPTYTGIEVYPFKLTTEETTPEKYKNLSLAIQAMVTRRQSQTVQIDRKKLLRDAVKRKLRSLSRRLSAIESDLKTVSDFEHFKKLGELLQINFDQVKTGMPQIVVDDVYTDPQQKLTIPLEPKLTPRQNVDSYFKKHRKGRQGREILRRRLEITRTEIASLNTIAQALESDFESASKQYEQDLEALLPNNRTSGGEQVRLPYREHLLSTGARIYVGRDGSDNDRTTFDFARPYELWFHAQQCPGSHVVLKFPNKSFEPTKAEIEETAAVAAWHSKARNDSLVPIIYTQRKYVRKPRKAKPGLVTVEREKSIMVTPRKPENSPIT